MLQSLGRKSAIWSERIIPDAFVFAVILSAVIFLLGIVVADKTPVEMVGYWYDGFWNFLGFSMQMVLILLTGYVLAQSPPIRAVIQRLAGQPKTSRQAILLIAVVTIFAGFINWGLGLVIGAILAIAVSLSAKQRGIRVHFPLAVAAGYLALSIHSAGFSSTAPLIVNTDNHFLFQQIGRIPFTETVLTSWNFLAVLAYIIVVPLLLVFLSPPEDEVREVGDFHESKPTEEGLDGEPAATLVKKLENSRLITALVVLPGLYYISSYFYDRGVTIQHNLMQKILSTI
jgi:short-chain fatty acids transporter